MLYEPMQTEFFPRLFILFVVNVLRFYFSLVARLMDVNNRYCCPFPSRVYNFFKNLSTRHAIFLSSAEKKFNERNFKHVQYFNRFYPKENERKKIERSE